MVGLNQNFRKVFVTTNNTILASGSATSDLAVGQIGLFDCSTNLSLDATPTYTESKGFYIAQGTPDLSYMPKGAGIRNETDKSKCIMGKNLVGYWGKAAAAGQSDIVAIGYDGVDTDKTMSGKCDEIKHLYVKLTGKPIENLFPGGTIRHYEVQGACCDSCGDSCASITDSSWVDGFIAQIAADTFLGGIPITKFIKTTKLSSGSSYGIKFESAWVDRTTDACYFNIFPYNADPVYIQISEYNPDWHGSPCDNTYPVTSLQDAAYPFGDGQYIIRLEELAKMWDFRYYSEQLPERLAEGTVLNTDPTLTYDMWTLIFDTERWSELGWSEGLRDRYQVDVFMRAGQTGFQDRLNSYVATIPVPLPTVTV
ncbi:MAG: hypothetical protein E6R03_17670 [Hyphomicrobiaceae bacterium]|nr:MAG: hypothetical protein E6R03_17670 [Hyphomicrobiaceae bacterium]